MKLLLTICLLLLLFVSCASVPTEKKPVDYNTKEFDIWIGCKIITYPDGKIDVKTFCGGNPYLFEILLYGVEQVGQKLGVFPKPEERDNSIVRIKP